MRASVVQLNRAAKIRIGISHHINPLIMKPIKVGISPLKMLMLMCFWGP